ncbi:hypothetical protein OG439_07600 [Amycolatopsis sp. NBC_01307]|uniref:hypothetical protein n=1 Tax=Amycolatopsis sp. NBC_01307 TaxID=2903561 RepID=UPI002E14C6FE|nr:hypothetical protein OG439_07600 [Amycolatopsis sp. NBC_01307]
MRADRQGTAVNTVNGSLTINNAVPTATERPVEVGEGTDSRTRREFEEAFRRAGGEGRLGRPIALVAENELGRIQCFTGTGDGSVLICALYGQKAVAVSEAVWDDVVSVPGHPFQGLQAVGFPLAQTDYIPADATAVEVGGGEWGRGLVVRPEVRWEPRPRVVMEASQARLMPPVEVADLTVRAIALLPWDLAEDGFEITREIRRRLERALPRMKLGTMLPLLSSRRGGSVAALDWIRPTGFGVHQSGRAALYDSVLTTRHGEVAARTSVRLILPAGRERIVRVFAEFQVNLETWQVALASATGAADFRITAAEIAELWQAAWEAAVVVVPGVLVDDPAAVPLMAPPVVELQVKSDDPREYGPGELLRLVTLTKVVDLSVFGTSADTLAREGALTVVAPVGFDHESRRQLTVTALTRLARAWGYVDADESDLGLER